MVFTVVIVLSFTDSKASSSGGNSGISGIIFWWCFHRFVNLACQNFFFKNDLRFWKLLMASMQLNHPKTSTTTTSILSLKMTGTMHCPLCRTSRSIKTWWFSCSEVLSPPFSNKFSWAHSNMAKPPQDLVAKIRKDHVPLESIFSDVSSKNLMLL